MRVCYVYYLLLLPLCCVAVQPYTPKVVDPISEPWRWRHEEALSHFGVLCIDEAADETLWFGTTSSIASYDGLAVTQIPFDGELLKKVTHQQETPWAKALLILPNGNPLVLIGESLVLRTDGEWRVIIQDVGPSAFGADLKLADDGSVWLLVSEGLWRISADLKECDRVIAVDVGCRLLSFCIDDVGRTWLVEQTGEFTSRLICFSAELNRSAEQPAQREEFPIPFNSVVQEARVTAGDDGLIWYVNSSALAGLQAFDPDQERWINSAKPSVRQNGFSILKRRDGSILGAGDGGVISFSDERGQLFYPSKQLGLPRVPFSLFESKTGRLWAVGRMGYVFSADMGTVEWKTYPGLNFQMETRAGVQWFLSPQNGAAVSYDSRSGEWFEYGSEDHQMDQVFLLFESSHGLIWAAGVSQNRAAVSVFDGTQWHRTEHPEFASRIQPNAVFEDSAGTVWFGASGPLLEGASKFGGALQFEVKNDLSVALLKHHAPPDFPYYITAFEETPDRVIWLGSTQVYRYDGVSAKAHQAPLLPGENTVAMVLDQQQTLWVAKEHLGICRWTGDSWEVFTKEDGLAGSKITDLLVLSDGSLLAASNEGLSRFDGQTWTPLAYSDWFMMSTAGNGIRQTVDGSIWLNYSMHDKQMFDIVPEAQGVCTIRHRPEIGAPETRIIDYLENVSPPGNSHIAWSGHDLWSATPREELQYAWRLDEGVWSHFSSAKSKTFLDLSSGRHVLEVRARDRAFNVDPTPARIQFTVIPPVWRQGWFISLISTLVGLILFFLWRWIMIREQRLIEQREQREAFILRQKEEHEAELRGELVSLHESLMRLEQELKQTRKPLIQPGKPDADPDHDFLNQLMGILDEHYSDWEFTREDLAKAVNMSLRTFQRRLKEVSGHSPKELIREFRITRAAELLTHTTLGVTDVAFKTGHDDSGNFTRIFKKHFGITPTEYRAENKAS